MRLSKLAVVVSGSAFAMLMTRAVVSEAQGVTPPGTGAIVTTTSALPPGPGLDLINQRCVFCHTAAQVFAARKTPAEWAATVQRMADRGAELAPDEQQAIVDYLAKNLASTGTATAPGASGAAAPAGAVSTPPAAAPRKPGGTGVRG
jgi:hypothetical protein